MAARIPFNVRLPSRYRVLRVIGRGGAGVVLQAHDERLRRDVAIKVFRQAPSTPEALIDQEREAQLLARSAHPNLVTIFDVGAEQAVEGAAQHLFLVMEYVDGPDLAQWLRVQKATTAQVADLGAALCSALQFVHRNGVLHCDIKPSNVLLTIGDDGELIPKLGDFGVAAVLRGEVPQSEFTVGTAAYLSPEQVEGDPLQEPSDVYALGLVLLEAATGQVAFPGGVIESAFARLDEQPRIDEHALPGPLAEVLRSMTSRDPEERITLADARTIFRSLRAAATTPASPQVYVPAARPQVTARPQVVELSSADRASALLTIDDAARSPLLDEATALAARTSNAEAALLLLADGDTLQLQSAYGIAFEDALELFRDHQLMAMGLPAHAPPRPITTVRIADRAGERLGTLAVVTNPISTYQQQTLDDIGHLIGHILEMRAATRRALLSR